MITFDAVTKRYPDGTVAVDGLDLVAPSGKITVFVGPSGCGKTTSLRMINRMIDPSSGTIRIDDRDVLSVSPPELRRGIGYVIQHAGLFPHRTVLDNIATVPFLVGTKKQPARARAMELLEQVGLDPAFAKRYPAQLSGGQQQRVGVARALAADPPVMLMDEPFSAVDPVVREQLQNEFLRLQQDLGKTIVFVTHDIDEAIKLGDQVAVLRVGGTLAQMAAPAELLARPSDPFVAGFVGRDRGYRALGFTHSSGVAVDDEPAVLIGSPISGAGDVARDGWALVIDDARVPQGWIAPAALPRSVQTDGITPDLLNLGGTVTRSDGTLRELLDAALSSPSGRGVVVDEAGALLGTVTAARALEIIDAQTRSNQTRSNQTPAGPRRRGRPDEDALVTPVALALSDGPPSSSPLAFWSYFMDHRSEDLGWLWDHTYLSVLPVVAGLIISLPLGWLAYRYKWVYPPALTLTGLLYTIPSIALFVIVPPLFGLKSLDPLQVPIALTVYSVALLVRVVADGLKSVPDETVQAATAIGYPAWRRFLGVELPIAVPVIAAGLRVATVSNVSLVAVAGTIGQDNLGRLFDQGIQLSTPDAYYPPIVLGIILCVLLAVVFDVVIVFGAKLATPWRRAVVGR